MPASATPESSTPPSPTPGSPTTGSPTTEPPTIESPMFSGATSSASTGPTKDAASTDSGTPQRSAPRHRKEGRPDETTSVPAGRLTVTPRSARRAVTVGDVVQAPLDLGDRVGPPVSAGAGHLAARRPAGRGERLGDAVGAGRRVGGPVVPHALAVPEQVQAVELGGAPAPVGSHDPADRAGVPLSVAHRSRPAVGGGLDPVRRRLRLLQRRGYLGLGRLVLSLGQREGCLLGLSGRTLLGGRVLQHGGGRQGGRRQGR